MKSSTTYYAYPGTAKNFLLLFAGSLVFFLLLVLLEPLSYFSHYKTGNNGHGPDKPRKASLLAAATLIAKADSKSEEKHSGKMAPDKAITAPVENIEKAVRMRTRHEIELKADRAFLKENNTRNTGIIKELSQVTEMHEFHFRNGRSRLDQQVLADKLDSCIQKCVEAPGSWNKIIILGFTDSRGSKLSNVKLGMKRAGWMKALLVEKGIPAEKITVASFGADLSIASNNNEEGRARNRRVEINLLGAGG